VPKILCNRAACEQTKPIWQASSPQQFAGQPATTTLLSQVKQVRNLRTVDDLRLLRVEIFLFAVNRGTVNPNTKLKSVPKLVGPGDPTYDDRP
jgi:hypothetical protein